MPSMYVSLSCIGKYDSYSVLEFEVDLVAERFACYIAEVALSTAAKNASVTSFSSSCARSVC